MVMMLVAAGWEGWMRVGDYCGGEADAETFRCTGAFDL